MRMIKVLFVFIVMVFTMNTVKAQHILRNDTLFLKKGGFLTKNQTIKLGKGAKENGNFKNIEVNITNYLRKSTSSNQLDFYALTCDYNYFDVRIIRIIDRGDRFIGKKYFVIIAVEGEIKRYQIDLDKAIEDGEVLIDHLKSKSSFALR